MSVLERLEPKKVFYYFEQLCAIPHGSRNTKAISDWCAAFARARGLEHYQDEANNVIIIQEATPGYEDAEPVILQGHLDMVCEKEPGCLKDMEREGLELAVEGDSVFARGTTLGGDDGIAAAMALAILDDPAIPHPRLEVVLTTEEEIGMLGAAALDVSPLRARQLINLDSEEEGVFTVGCAGGSLTWCALPVTRAPFEGAAVHLRVGGLTGGHSGTEINKGRANADLLLGRLLRAMEAAGELRLVSVSGGAKDNAIPVEAEAVAVVADSASARAVCMELAACLQREYRVTEPSMAVSVTETETAETPMDSASTRRVICFLSCVPNGVQEMSREIEGLVQTSLNLGVLHTGDREVDAAFCIRSSVASQKEMVNDRLRCLTEMLGGTVNISGDYPAWEYRPDSPLRERMLAVFREQYGHDPRIEAIHAGVECGLLCGKLPGLDCVSIGPDLTEIHTPRERMSISSVRRVWDFLLEVLKRSE